MQRHAGDDEPDAGGLGGRRDLRQHDDPDEGRRRREQGHQQRVRRSREAPQRELVGDVGDDRRADADAGARKERDGVGERGRRLCDRRGRDRHGGDEHRGGEAVDAGEGGAAPLGDAVGEDDVEREEDRVRGRERKGEGLRGEMDAGEQPHAGRREGECRGVALRPRPEGGERDDGQELDRGHRAERQAVDRQVEAGVHRRQDGAPRQQQRAAFAIQLVEVAPRAPPRGEHDGRCRDAQPRDAQDVDAGEQQDGERGPEVVEDRADEEVGVRRKPHDH
jgi:hypothetical protein